MSTVHKNSFWKSNSLFERWSNMSLRNRIAFYYTIATAFLIAVVFTIIYFMVDSFVYKHFDEEIKKEITETLSEAHAIRNKFTDLSQFRSANINDDNEDYNEDDEPKKHMADVDPEFIQVVDKAGNVFLKTRNLGTNALSLEPERRGTACFNTILGSTTVRQAQVPLVDHEGLTIGYLLVASPIKNAIIVLRDLQTIFFFSFPLIILTLFILTRLIAGKSIRPIEKVIAAAEKMTQINLNERVPLPHHHDELFRLSSTINALLDRIQDAFQREKQFTADASHELKTPLAVIKGTLEILVRKPREREQYETKVQFCLTELNRMARLIDQLLMLARYESNKMNPRIESVLLSSPIDDVIKRVLPFALEKQISFNVQNTENMRVAADPAMIEMILENIISNALKYSPTGSSITIAVERHDGTIICSITDQGIGIPEEKLQAIFERFYRVDSSRNSNTGGFGLGLSIVKKLADLQLIKVSVKSQKNRGTSFSLIFPAS